MTRFIVSWDGKERIFKSAPFAVNGEDRWVEEGLKAEPEGNSQVQLPFPRGIYESEQEHPTEFNIDNYGVLNMPDGYKKISSETFSASSYPEEVRGDYFKSVNNIKRINFNQVEEIEPGNFNDSGAYVNLEIIHLGRLKTIGEKILGSHLIKEVIISEQPEDNGIIDFIGQDIKYIRTTKDIFESFKKYYKIYPMNHPNTEFIVENRVYIYNSSNGMWQERGSKNLSEQPQQQYQGYGWNQAQQSQQQYQGYNGNQAYQSQQYPGYNGNQAYQSQQYPGYNGNQAQQPQQHQGYGWNQTQR